MKVFIYDLDKCNGCHNCQISCKDEHVGNDWSPIAKPQPDTGHFWCKVDEEVCGKTARARELPFAPLQPLRRRPVREVRPRGHLQAR